MRQSSFSDVDRYCSPQRQTAILSVVIRFVGLARTAVEGGASPDRIAALPIRTILQRVAEEYGEERIEDIRALWKQLEAEFDALQREAPVAAPVAAAGSLGATAPAALREGHSHAG